MNDFDPTPQDPGYLYMRLADHIADRINRCELTPGTRLPGERDFAHECRVSIGTVRRATDELRERGLVVTLPAKGSFIAAREVHGHDRDSWR